MAASEPWLAASVVTAGQQQVSEGSPELVATGAFTWWFSTDQQKPNQPTPTGRYSGKRQYPLHSRPLPSLSSAFFKTSNVHEQFHSDVKNKQKKNSWVLFLTAASTEGFRDRSISPSPATKNNSRCRFNAHMSCTENGRTRWLRYCGRCLDKCLRLSVALFISWRNIDTQIFAKGQWDPFLFWVKVVNNANRWD